MWGNNRLSVHNQTKNYSQYKVQEGAGIAQSV